MVEEQIALYERQKKKYEEVFDNLCSHHRTLKWLCSIPGIGQISAVKILAITVNAERFQSSARFLAYSGLVSHIKESGGNVYGRKRPRYSRTLKSVFKYAALSVINGTGPLRSYYEHLVQKGVSVHNARNALARYIARICYGIMKQPKRFSASKYKERKKTITGTKRPTVKRKAG